MNEKDDILLWLSIGSSILPIVAGLFNRRHLIKPLVLLLLYASIVFAVEVSSVLMIRVFSAPTTTLYQVFTLIEFILFSMIFYQWQAKGAQQVLTRAIVVLFSVLWVYVELTAHVTLFDSLVVSVEAVLLVILAVTSLLMLALENTGNVFGNPRFWVSSGVLLYFAGNLIVFAVFNEMSEQKDATALNIWRFHAVLNIIAQAFYMTSYLCLGRFRK